ncbi:MAG: Coenzyme F420 hydrogenase/dehydrogenase, beta subunit C-terminal domain [Fibrobacter sp.]|nr:Coenzyme F420 hydrogenase/dehydrogenase, beta subunit C-terminal domain [Fibrobacter sp.]
MNNICLTTKNELCTGCGLCEDVCPAQAISIKRGVENTPTVNLKKCVNCGKCIKICPGIGCDIEFLSKNCFSDGNIKKDYYIGRYLETFVGHSNDNEIRYHSASGGVLSHFLIYLLEKGLINGAVVTKFSSSDAMYPETFIATSKEEILSAKSSKYCPVSLNGITKKILAFEGKVVVVGLPCHIQSLRKRLTFDSKLKEKIVGLFSIYCSSNRNFNAQKFLLDYYKIRREDVTKFAYRDDGCLGNMKVFVSGKEPLLNIPFIDYYGALRSFFKPRRCLSCIDHYGELADINFGDIHIAPYSNDRIGVSSIIVRNSKYRSILMQAVHENVLSIEPIPCDIVNESQKEMLYPKQRKAHALMNMDRLLHRMTPVYDKELKKPYLKDYVSEILCNCQRYVGRHPFLWFVIRILFSHKISKEYKR